MLTEKRIKEFASLNRRRNRERLDAFLVEGTRSVDAALEAGADVICLISTSKAESAKRSGRARELGGHVEVVSDREIARLSEVETSQGVLLVARRRLTTETALFSCSTVLILDGVQDPGNVGSLVRTAAWFGVDAVLAGPDTADFFNPKVVRASMGGVWDVSMAQSTDLVSWIESWKQQGGRCFAADLDGEKLESWIPVRPSALVVGSEAHGVSEAVRDIVDGCIHVSGSEKERVTESLNASVAGGLLIAAWMRFTAV